MKKVSFLVIPVVVLLSVFLFASCNKDEDGNEVITVNGKAADTVNMDANGDSKTVVVRGTKEWTAESSSWITVYPQNGPANTDVTVTISVGINEGEERAGSALFTLSSSEFVDVIVVQPAITVNPNN